MIFLQKINIQQQSWNKSGHLLFCQNLLMLGQRRIRTLNAGRPFSYYCWRYYRMRSGCLWWVPARSTVQTYGTSHNGRRLDGMPSWNGKFYSITITYTNIPRSNKLDIIYQEKNPNHRIFKNPQEQQAFFFFFFFFPCALDFPSLPTYVDKLTYCELHRR